MSTANASSRRSPLSSSVLAPRNVKMAALRSCDATMTDAPVGSRASRKAHRVETPSCISRARMVSARASWPSFTRVETSRPSRAIAIAALTAPPPQWVDMSCASVLRPSSSSRNELSAFSMLMRSMRSFSTTAIVSMVALPTVRAFMRFCSCPKDQLLAGRRHPIISVGGLLSLPAASMRGAESGTVVRRHEVELRAERDDAGRIHVALAAVIMPLDVIHVDGRGDAGLLIKIAQIVREVRIVDDTPQVALEMAVVDGIEAYERREQPQVGLGDRAARKVALA